MANRQERQLVDHAYIDHIDAPYDVTTEERKGAKLASCKGKGFFPHSIVCILKKAMSGENEPPMEYQDNAGVTRTIAMVKIVSWCSHGRAFIVYEPKLFEKLVLPTFYGTSSYSTFQRQLNMYEFKRLSHGRDKGAYYHEKFLRGREDLVWSMKRRSHKGVYGKPIPNPKAEPDFYKMRPLPFNNRPVQCPMEMNSIHAQMNSYMMYNQGFQSYPVVHASEEMPMCRPPPTYPFPVMPNYPPYGMPMNQNGMVPSHVHSQPYPFYPDLTRGENVYSNHGVGARTFGEGSYPVSYSPLQHTNKISCGETKIIKGFDPIAYKAGSEDNISVLSDSKETSVLDVISDWLEDDNSAYDASSLWKNYEA